MPVKSPQKLYGSTNHDDDSALEWMTGTLSSEFLVFKENDCPDDELDGSLLSTAATTKFFLQNVNEVLLELMFIC